MDGDTEVSIPRGHGWNDGPKVEGAGPRPGGDVTRNRTEATTGGIRITSR